MHQRGRAGVAAAVVAAAVASLGAVPAGADGVAGTAWWCAPGVLDAAVLPPYLPATECSVVGRVVARDELAVEVPPVGRGVVATAYAGSADRALTVWTDAAGTHLAGDPRTAAAGYVREIVAYLATGAGDLPELVRKAAAARALVYGGAAGYREAPSTAELLDDADDVERALVERGAGAVGDPDLVARALELAGYLGEVAVRGGDLPGVPDLARRVGDLRAAYAGAGAGRVDDLLTDALAVLAYLGETLATTEGAAPALVDRMAGVVADLRRAAGVAGVAPRPDREHEQTLAEVAEVVHAALPVPGEDPAHDTGPEPADPTGLGAAASPHECVDTAFAYFASKPRWTPGGTVGWYYDDWYTEGTYEGHEVRAAASRAFTNITRLRNVCGWRDWRPNISHAYRGVAPTTANIGQDSQGRVLCLRSDGRNVLGWYDLPPSQLARACIAHSGTGRMLSADVILSRDKRWHIPEGDVVHGYQCTKLYDGSGMFDMEGVLTHEFGHVVGLNHVAESSHGRLTMSTTIDGACQRSERTLGRGDARGLSGLYGRVYY